MSSLRIVLVFVAIFLAVWIVSCSGSKSARVSPNSTNSQEVPLEKLGDDWDDQEEQTAEEVEDIDLEEDLPALIG